MPDPLPPAANDAAQMGDVCVVATMLSCSKRHVTRLDAAGLIPPSHKLGALVRWPLNTGDPTTGIADWIAAGCPPLIDGGQQSSSSVAQPTKPGCPPPLNDGGQQ
ncbi:helix-turn-helix transcriptional regulator [Adhaeretor mobilis]|uniref:Helix-turn-helix domain-containing protein n=1 Tax=Adhaeretor mobilis TaxID=1930276 RepID=A0A517MTP2_9BACT|nr:hypothetical protein [Adhaeretor mobilis]QDS98147.1 hypothetical protein HG15A2_14200 [Adhaeretor mobilis]